MQPILIHIHAQSHGAEGSPERLTELLNGVLRSEGMQLETVEIIKVAAARAEATGEAGDHIHIRGFMNGAKCGNLVFRINLQTYLGDSVYAEYDGSDISVFLNHGERSIADTLIQKNRIVMEPETIHALMRFLQQCQHHTK